MKEHDNFIEKVTAELKLPNTSVELDQRVQLLLAKRTSTEHYAEEALSKQTSNLFYIAATTTLCLLSYSAGVFATNAKYETAIQHRNPPANMKAGTMSSEENIERLLQVGEFEALLVGKQMRETAFGQWVNK